MACADPFTANAPNVHRSASGIEVDWSFTIAAGCSVKVQLVCWRPNRAVDDDRVEVHLPTPASVLTAGNHVMNQLITTGRNVHVHLMADDKLYAILDVDPSTVP